MKLGAKQELFTITMARFEVWIYECTPYRVRSGEFLRSRAEAKRLASIGKGIVNSNHCLKLAKDIFLSRNGNVTWEYKDYRVVAEYWLKQHELCRWGGAFRGNGRGPGRDAVHFSFIHNGVQ